MESQKAFIFVSCPSHGDSSGLQPSIDWGAHSNWVHSRQSNRVHSRQGTQEHLPIDASRRGAPVLLLAEEGFRSCCMPWRGAGVAACRWGAPALLLVEETGAAACRWGASVSVLLLAVEGRGKGWAWQGHRQGERRCAGHGQRPEASLCPSHDAATKKEKEGDFFLNEQSGTSVVNKL
jgi:hypothetical protein